MAKLLRHRRFRRLVAVRLASQGGDAVVQVGMAAYILFSPQNQPDAWAVAAMIALLMLPFSVVGPFVSPLLDRFARQRTVIWTDAVRCVLALGTAVLVLTGQASGARLYVLLLVVLGLNRLQLAALSAGMPHTVRRTEYLDAAAVMPMIGPAAMVLGGLVAAAIRLLGARGLPPGWPDAIIFGLAAALFGLGIVLMTGFGHWALGPDQPAAAGGLRAVWTGISVGINGLWRARPAAVGVGLVFGARIGYGLVMTLVIVAYRHHFGAGQPLESVMVAMGVWFLASGVGFAASGLIASPLAAQFGVRPMIAGALLLCGLVTATGAVWFTPAVLVASGLVQGLCLQSVKIGGDTVVQAHVADQARGRVMVIYDIINNLGYVVGAVLAATVLPDDGRAPVVLGGLAVGLVVAGASFWLASRESGRDYDRGTPLAESR